MNVIRMENKDCAQFRRYVDSFASGELLVETGHQMVDHAAVCEGCGRLYQDTLRLRGAVRAAVSAELPPPELRARISDQLRSAPAHSGWFAFPRLAPQFGLAAAAVVVAIGASWFALLERTPILYEISAADQDHYITKLVSRVAPILRPGLADHLHCAVARKYPRDYPKPADLQPHQQLGAEFEPVKPIVRDLVPAQYQLVMAHRCSYKDRKFVHFVFRDDARQMSIIVSRKESGETYANSGLAPTILEYGQSLYQERIGSYHINGFESRTYLGYVISDLGQENGEIAAKIAPKLTEHLDRI